jgi:hypothetical protein
MQPSNAFVGFLQRNRQFGDELRAALRAARGVVVGSDRSARIVQLQRQSTCERVWRQAAAKVDDID